MTDIQHQREHLELLRVVEDNTRILREVLEHLRDIDARLARIEGRTLPPTEN
ncbi:MAG TPA: hypothetical protein VFB50_22495 [Chloroflexota bacterium]|nr:hypothetical protein [Chloroflexota bacterium]